MRVVHRVTKQAARYISGGGQEKCGYCRYFRAPSSCGKVIGPVTAQGWCKHFSQAMVSQGGGSFGPSNGGASLVLDFLTPGTLDPRITFTRASTGTYFDAAGVMQTAAINAPRWDYDPATLALRGLLIEEARTNLLTFSSNPSNPIWLKSAITSAAPTVTPNQSIAPDGTLTAARVTYSAVSAAGAACMIQQNISVTAAVHAFSVYLKGAVGGEQTYLTIRIGTTPYYTSSRLTLTANWQRYVLVSPVALTAAAWFFHIGTDLRDGTQTSTPAQSIDVWGAQLEAGAFPTSYIPTTSAAVPRAIDLASMTGSNFSSWFNNAAGTFATEMMYVGISPGALGRLIELSDGSSANVLTLYPDPGSGGRFVLGSTIATVAGTAITIPGLPPASVVNKASIAYGTGRSMCVNLGAGPSAVTGVAGGIAAVSRLDFANRGLAPDRPGSLWLRRVNFWSRQFTDAELQSVTT